MDLSPPWDSLVNSTDIWPIVDSKPWAVIFFCATCGSVESCPIAYFFTLNPSSFFLMLTHDRNFHHATYPRSGFQTWTFSGASPVKPTWWCSALRTHGNSWNLPRQTSQKWKVRPSQLTRQLPQCMLPLRELFPRSAIHSKITEPMSKLQPNGKMNVRLKSYINFRSYANIYL